MLTTIAAGALALAATAAATDVPCLSVLACPSMSSLEFSHSVPNRTDFPGTHVALCYSDTHIHLTLVARDEASFYYNDTQGTNDDIWAYEVMEAFIHRGSDDPQTYLEFEVSPGNVTYQALVYNPTKKRAADGPFDHFFVTDPAADGFAAATTLNRDAGLWTSVAEIPLGLFNVDRDQAGGTEWRMNFFRTVTSEDAFPDQELGAWSPPDEANFHITKFMGRVTFA